MLASLYSCGIGSMKEMCTKEKNQEINQKKTNQKRTSF